MLVSILSIKLLIERNNLNPYAYSAVNKNRKVWIPGYGWNIVCFTIQKGLIGEGHEEFSVLWVEFF